MVDLAAVKEAFRETVYYEAEINLLEEDFSITCEGDFFVLEIFGVRILKQVPDSDEEFTADDYAVWLQETAGDLKEVVVDAKVRQLEKYLPPVLQEVQKRLKSASPGIPYGELLFSIERRGYHYSHYLSEREAESGYPVIALCVTRREGGEIDFPVNIYYPETQIDDMDLLIEKILSELF